MPAQQIEVTQDTGQYIVEIMSDTAHQQADGLHLLRLPELSLNSGHVRDITMYRNKGEATVLLCNWCHAA